MKLQAIILESKINFWDQKENPVFIKLVMGRETDKPGDLTKRAQKIATKIKKKDPTLVGRQFIYRELHVCHVEL